MRRLSLAGPPLLAIVIGLVTNVASGGLSGLQQVSWPVLGVLAFVAVWVEVRRQRRPEDDPEERLRAAATALADAVRRQWTREAEVRDLLGSRLLPQPWSTTGRPVLPRGADVDVPADRPKRTLLGRLVAAVRHPGRPAPAAEGGFEDLVAALASRPRRQWVVLGEAGAGKSVLTIRATLALLADRVAGDPVPVLLPLSSWRVGEEGLREWVARALGAEYPALGNAGKYGPGAPDRLVDRGLVLPVLDGLDELPPGLRAEAVRRVGAFAALGVPFLLTSRGDEYQAAVEAAGRVPVTAAVVELGSVDRTDAIAYLSADRVGGDPRWEPVFAELRASPGGPLARALTTPLMIGLLRTAYDDPATEPAGLLALTDPDDVERHLLDGFTDAVYPPGSRSVARSSLRFLAEHLREQDTYRLAWWRLDRALPSAARSTGVAVGLVAGVITAAAVWLMVLPTVVGAGGGAPLGAAAGLVAWVVVGAVVRDSAGVASGPRRVAADLRDRRGELAGRASRWAVKGGAAGLVTGLVAEVGYTTVFGIVDPARLGLLLGVVFGVMTGLAYGVAGWLEAPADSVRAADPITALRADRSAKLVRLLVFGLAFGLTAGVLTGLVAGPVIGLLDGVGGGLVGVAVGLARGPQVWTRFTAVRFRLAARGRLPWRLVAFLDDAHRRGVLREDGGYYRFRHGLLQDRLAGGPPASAEPAEDDVEEPHPHGSRLRRLVVLGLVTVVAGAGLGVGLPLVGGLQTQCGLSPFDLDVRYLRAGPSSECVGVTDGSYSFADELDAVSESVARENADMRTSGHPYVRVALLLPLNAGTWTWAQIRHAVEGAHVAQSQHNAGAPVKVELVLVNEGSRQLHWRPVVDRLIDMSAEEHPLVAVVGLGVTTEESTNAMRALAHAGLPMVAATANGRGVRDVPGLVRIMPGNDEFAAALHRSWAAEPPALLVEDEPSDPYTADLSRSFRERWPDVRVLRAGSAYPGAGFACASPPGSILFSGRKANLAKLVDVLVRLCPGTRVRIGTEMLEAGDRGVGPVPVSYASPVDPAGWDADTKLAPEGYEAFKTSYAEEFGDSLGDGFALLHHDAAAAAFAALAAAADPTAAGLMAGLRHVTVVGATGTIRFDADGDPLGKPIPVIDLPERIAGRVPYMTG